MQIPERVVPRRKPKGLPVDPKPLVVEGFPFSDYIGEVVPSSTPAPFYWFCVPRPGKYQEVQLFIEAMSDDDIDITIEVKGRGVVNTIAAVVGWNELPDTQVKKGDRIELAMVRRQPDPENPVSLGNSLAQKVWLSAILWAPPVNRLPVPKPPIPAPAAPQGP